MLLEVPGIQNDRLSLKQGFAAFPALTVPRQLLRWNPVGRAAGGANDHQWIGHISSLPFVLFVNFADYEPISGSALSVTLRI